MTWMPEEYVRLRLDKGEAYVRKDSQDQLKRVDAVIFDCDGVLVDIRESYNKTISKTVAYILEALVGWAIPESMISDDLIFLFRKTGGFNNDWDTVYGILMFILCLLPLSRLQQLARIARTLSEQPDPFIRLPSIKRVQGSDGESRRLDDKFLRKLGDELREFTRLLDMTGVNSVDKNLERALGPSRGVVRSLKGFFRDRSGVGEGIIATVFEEFFCGSQLFLETHKIRPRFYEGKGMIENEKVIVRPESLDQLVSIFGKPNLGIASGSNIEPARYVLKDILGRFDPKSLVFLDRMKESERELLKDGAVELSLEKPNPFSLLKASEAFESFTFVVYVGDSMEDVAMADAAAKSNSRFLSAGVYGHSHPQNEIIRCFLESGCDLVFSSVNELPLILGKLRAEKN